MPTTYALLGTYPPTQCGLATFGAALLSHLPEPGDDIAVVRVLDKPMPCFTDEVAADLVNGSAASAAAAAQVLNGFDVVIAQHEYGIYGGPDGQDVVPLLQALQVPTIVVLHTVIPHGAADNRVPAQAAGNPGPAPNPGRPKVLTWGLLGPGKGIEHAIDAMALLRDMARVGAAA